MLQLPAIHRNGTSSGELLEQVCQASDHLREAIEALRDAGPNARDYYVIGPGAFAQAQLEHGERMEKLRDVRKELQQLAEGISDGGHFATQERAS